MGDRELMAAYVSRVNESAFCIAAHTATSSRAYQDRPRVEAVLADLESAPVAERLRATLRLLGKLTGEGTVGAQDMRAVLAAGVSPRQVRDTLAVCAAFNATDRLGDAFGFELLAPRASRQAPVPAQAGLPVAEPRREPRRRSGSEDGPDGGGQGGGDV